MFATAQNNVSKGWLALSISSLILAGILAGVLVVGRLPPFHHLFSDPLFFKRCLIVHVELSLFVWFFSFFVFLFSQLPGSKNTSLWQMSGLFLAFSGVAALVLSAGMPQSQPVLNNYLPVIDHPLFHAGLLLFSLGVAISILGGALFPSGEERSCYLPAVMHSGLRAAAVALLMAIATFWASWLATPGYLEGEAYYETLFWGTGHVLQFANMATMLSVWLLLVTKLTGKPPVSQKLASVLFILLVLPTLAAPLVAMGGTITSFYRSFFTQLMRWAIFPVTLIFLFFCLKSLWRSRGQLKRKGLALGLYTSFVLTILGFVLGAMIRGSNTLVPAHYHASIGAVTVAFMCATFLLFEPLGYRVPEGLLSRWARRQPFLFGLGQTVFAMGFGLAGSYGMGRKLYGTEQHIRHTGETVGLVVMGLGGLLAMIGGVLFLYIVARTLMTGRRLATVPAEESEPAVGDLVTHHH